MSVEPEPSRIRRILVVDDNHDAADSLCTLLRLSQFDVRAAYSGDEAIRAAKEFRPDCILSDIGLPRLDGYHLAETLRQDPEFKHILLIAISGSYDPAKAKAAGFDYDFTKPADPKYLLALLTRILQMEKRLDRAATLIQEQGEAVGEARDLMKEVKADMKEIKAELRDVKEDVNEIKDKLDGE